MSTEWFEQTSLAYLEAAFTEQPRYVLGEGRSARKVSRVEFLNYHHAHLMKHVKASIRRERRAALRGQAS
jgi:hypothetical protein